MTKESFLRDQLINYDPMGFIDPFNDLGEFDFVQMKFVRPVKELVNKYSGQPYSIPWQYKIAEMRKLFIEYQMVLYENDKETNFQRRSNKDSKDHVDAVVTTYLKLGFNFTDIEKRVSLSRRQLQRGWRRSDYVATTSPEFYLKQDLKEGYCFPYSAIPKNMSISEEL